MNRGECQCDRWSSVVETFRSSDRCSYQLDREHNSGMVTVRYLCIRACHRRRWPLWSGR
jgi:hypothetical protein